MPVTAQSMIPWCRRILGADDGDKLTLEQYLEAIPRLESLDPLPSGTRILVRGDVDAKPGAKVGEGDVRLRSMLDTLQYGQQRGWVQVIFGHIGRKPEGSLEKVRNRFEELLRAPVEFITDWLDEETLTIPDRVDEQIAAVMPGGFAILENTRRYKIETALWKATAEELPSLAERLAQLATQFAEKVARVYVHEAFSAGSLDSSSVVVPAAMERVAMGAYEAAEFDGPLRRCLDTSLVVFSGLKIDKLDDLAAMIERGKIRWVIAAGSLAMALKKGAAELDGQEFGLGVAENPDHADKPYFIPAERIQQAKAMIERGRRQEIRFVLPVDFVLQDGQIVEQIGPKDQQFDVGPRTSEVFEEAIGEFIGAVQTGRQDVQPVAFHNGVFGMFEDPRFENGTKRFIPQLRRMKEAGIEVYVGGGEGGKALEQYGQPDWVTHSFTAGGTVLNALGSNPVPYLVALHLATQQQAE